MTSLFFIPRAYASVDTLIRKVDQIIINPIIYFFFAAALVYFIAGLVEFLANTDNEEKRTTGKQHMLWGFVGMLIMIAVFTIMRILIDTFGITGINEHGGAVNL
jgi:succinate dehydrogenase/fumarate reductase cytochrome b subunit